MIPEDRQKASEIVKMVQAELGRGSRRLMAELFDTTPIYVSFARNLTRSNYHTQAFACPQEVVNKILTTVIKMGLN